MPRRQRSPVRAVCKPWPFPRRAGERRRSLCKWICDRDPAGAEFVDRRDPSRTAVLHPSTKRAGWQVSFFDERGAVSDVIRPTCTQALDYAGVMPAGWKLRAVAPLGRALRRHR